MPQDGSFDDQPNSGLSVGYRAVAVATLWTLIAMFLSIDAVPTEEGCGGLDFTWLYWAGVPIVGYGIAQTIRAKRRDSEGPALAVRYALATVIAVAGLVIARRLITNGGSPYTCTGG